MTDHIPLLEFDPDRDAIIAPSALAGPDDLPGHCVLCFFREVIERTKEELGLLPLRPLKSEMGEFPVYAGTYAGQSIGIVPATVGAPLAAILLEVLIARGGRKFVVCGGAGVLDSSIASGDIVVPVSALRDEGTSYHYLPPGRDAHASAAAVRAITQVLEQHGCRYTEGKTWTTDAFYRETPGRIARRRRQGCVTVDMEAAAFFAVAEFRRVRLGQLLYGVDDVSGSEWDPRGLRQTMPTRETLFRLAVEACLAIGDSAELAAWAEGSLSIQSGNG